MSWRKKLNQNLTPEPPKIWPQNPPTAGCHGVKKCCFETSLRKPLSQTLKQNQNPGKPPPVSHRASMLPDRRPRPQKWSELTFLCEIMWWSFKVLMQQIFAWLCKWPALLNPFPKPTSPLNDSSNFSLRWVPLKATTVVSLLEDQKFHQFRQLAAQKRHPL